MWAGKGKVLKWGAAQLAAQTSKNWRTRQDLNLQPFDPKSNALSN
jgi:hypothetical protein